jgi:hypothetical protein
MITTNLFKVCNKKIVNYSLKDVENPIEANIEMV